MARIPFKRATAAFDEVARARLCSSSSGSEHSGAEDSSAELSDLVNSFIEKDDETEDEQETDDPDTENYTLCSSSSSSLYGLETSEEFMLRRLLGCLDEAEDDAKTMLRNHIYLAYKHMAISSTQQGFKRDLMCQLREKGLDAGLCKTKCKKTGQFPSGDHEYIDVIVNGTRYIVEANLIGEFVIARPTDQYQSLLDLFPPIFVGEPDALKKVSKLMCNALKKSMKNCDMHVPPWRRNGYMLAKWFGSYKRTTSSISNKTVNVADGSDPSAKKMSMETPTIFQKCRVEVERKRYLRVGNLVQVFRGIN